MIRVLEQIAREYEARGHALGLSGQQKEAMAGMLREFKKDMWLKEAVLLGIFQELEDKRRYGLLQDHIDYRTANTLTGGIETDELTLFIETLAKLQAILTTEQRARLRELWHPTLTLRVPQGMTTMIALMSLEGIGRLYNGWRDELRLTDAQAHALRSLLMDARAELLRQGTSVDINRVEGDDLALMPDVEPESLREKMTRTGDLEAIAFNTLFEFSEKAEALLTGDQRKTLQDLKHQQALRAAHGRSYGSHAGSHQNTSQDYGSEHPRFEFFLDQIGSLRLSDAQVAQLVALKDETRKATLVDQAKLKASELDLLDQLDRFDSRSASFGDTLTAKVRQLEDIRGRITQMRLEAYLKAKQILTPEQRVRVHPVEPLLGSS
jgi:Spy/CpxP family protein refolding chaperone